MIGEKRMNSEKVYLDFNDVLIVPREGRDKIDISSRSKVQLEVVVDKFIYSKHSFNGIPIMNANLDTIGTFEMVEELSKHHMLSTIHKHYLLEQLQSFSSLFNQSFNVLSSGIKEEDIDRIIKIYHYYKERGKAPKFIMFDVANGYLSSFIDTIKRMREIFKNEVTIIAGNVATPEGAKRLVLAGADIIKIGIGPGEFCTTRYQTGVGVPQLSAIMECSSAVKNMGAYTISDGGCKTPGDVAKAFVAGADFVMLGGMLAGHDECNLPKISKEGKTYLEHYGMSSKTANNKYNNGLQDYRASEGLSKLVEYKGFVKNTIKEILGGLRSTCTLTGNSNLYGLRNEKFIRVNNIKG